MYPQGRHSIPSAIEQTEMVWLCVQCKPQQERKAEINLKRQGLTVYLPEEPGRASSNTDRRPMFPGYLFILADMDRQDLSVVRSTQGCIALLRHGLHPAPVPLAVMQSVREAEATLFDCFEDGFGLSPGSQYELLEPSFRGHTATFLSLDRHKRARVLVTLLNSEREISVAQTSLGERQTS